MDSNVMSKHLPLVKDGDLIAIVQHLIQARGLDTVRVTKGEGHAAEADVEQGRVREEDKLGNAEADNAADLGRRQQSEVVMDARRALLNAWEYWYSIILQLHRFMVAVSPVSVNHDERGGSALDPLVWGRGSRMKQRKVYVRVNIDLSSLPRPPGFLHGPWVQVHGACVTGADVATWPKSVSLLCKLAALLGFLHWPADSLGIWDILVSRTWR